VQPKVLSGDWQSVPDERNTDVARVRVEVHGKLWRAQSLTDKGEVDTNEKPTDFGLVALSPGNFILVQADSDKDPVNYVGFTAQEDKLTLYLFTGGDTGEGEAAFKALLADLQLTLDPGASYETRLIGDVTPEKLKALFTELLAHPAKYDGQGSVYVPLKH
jgi:hypothetical protein